MRRILAVTMITTVALGATATAAWALRQSGSDETGAGGSAGSCEKTDHGTAADTARTVTGLTAATQAALTDARRAADRAGHTLTVNSGFRSAAYQQRVYDCWVAQTGSEAAARQHALPPSESAHVKGYAIDVAPPSAAAWLEHTAGRYGLCRRYDNEAWHFEYQASYKQHGCPKLLDHP